MREATSGPLWFQLYIFRDRGLTQALVRRAEQAGCTALVLTVDAPMLGRRERDLINGFHVPADTPLRYYFGYYDWRDGKRLPVNGGMDDKLVLHGQS